jgi:hypothetical protein
MSKTKEKTPMELLREEKEMLEMKSKILVRSLDDTLEYSRENIGSILRQSAMEAILPMVPSFIRTMIKRNNCREENRVSQGSVSFLADTLLELLPLVLRGKKGIIAAFILKKLKNKIWG